MEKIHFINGDSGGIFRDIGSFEDRFKASRVVS